MTCVEVYASQAAFRSYFVAVMHTEPWVKFCGNGVEQTPEGVGVGLRMPQVDTLHTSVYESVGNVRTLIGPNMRQCDGYKAHVSLHKQR